MPRRFINRKARQQANAVAAAAAAATAVAAGRPEQGAAPAGAGTSAAARARELAAAATLVDRSTRNTLYLLHAWHQRRERQRRRTRADDDDAAVQAPKEDGEEGPAPPAVVEPSAPTAAAAAAAAAALEIHTPPAASAIEHLGFFVPTSCAAASALPPEEGDDDDDDDNTAHNVAVAAVPTEQCQGALLLQRLPALDEAAVYYGGGGVHRDDAPGAEAPAAAAPARGAWRFPVKLKTVDGTKFPCSLRTLLRFPDSELARWARLAACTDGLVCLPATAELTPTVVAVLLSFLRDDTVVGMRVVPPSLDFRVGTSDLESACARIGIDAATAERWAATLRAAESGAREAAAIRVREKRSRLGDAEPAAPRQRQRQERAAAGAPLQRNPAALQMLHDLGGSGSGSARPPAEVLRAAVRPRYRDLYADVDVLAYLPPGELCRVLRPPRALQRTSHHSGATNILFWSAGRRRVQVPLMGGSAPPPPPKQRRESAVVARKRAAASNAANLQRLLNEAFANLGLERATPAVRAGRLEDWRSECRSRCTSTAAERELYKERVAAARAQCAAHWAEFTGRSSVRWAAPARRKRLQRTLAAAGEAKRRRRSRHVGVVAGLPAAAAAVPPMAAAAVMPTAGDRNSMR